MKKAMKIILCVLLLIVIVVAVLFCFSDKILIGKTEIKAFNTDGDSFKVAVISDTQLPPTEEALKNDDKYVQNLKKAVELELENDGKKHSYKIYAVDSWGEESKDYISISQK